jgi:hypothetical protein
VGILSFLGISKKGPTSAARGMPMYKGSLAQTALPEMLAVIYRHSAAGLIEAKHGDIVKRIYVKDGTFTHAASTDPNDAILTYLLRTGRLTIDQLTSLSKVSFESDKQRCALVVERHYLSPSQLYAALRERVEAIVWSLFWWEDGEVHFSPGELEEGSIIHLRVPIRHVIMHGVKRSPKAKTLVTRLGRKDTVYLPSHSIGDLVDTALDANEYKLLALVDGKRTLYEICAAGPCSASDNAKLLYAFYVLRLIQKPPAAAVSPDESSVRDVKKAADESDEDDDENEDDEDDDEEDDEEDEEDEDEEDEDDKSDE